MDIIIFQSINSFADRWVLLDSLAIFFADYLGYLLVAGLLLFFLQDARRRWMVVAQAFAASILARYGLTELIRLFWQNPRPFVEIKANVLIPYELTGSFPSGHASFFFGLATVIYLYNKKSGLLFFCAGFLISLARVFAGVHWPSDIVGGLLVGVFSGLVITLLFRKSFSTEEK